MRIMQCSQLKSAFYRFVIFCSASTRRLASGRRRTWLAICRVLATVTRPVSWAQRCTFSVGLRRWSTSSHVMCIASISTRCSGASFIRESLSQHPFPDSLITMIYEQLWIAAIVSRLSYRNCDKQPDVHFRWTRWRSLTLSLSGWDLLSEDRLPRLEDASMDHADDNQQPADRPKVTQCMWV